MGRFGYDIRVTHADDPGVHDDVVHIARGIFEDFWREHRDDLHREYEYQVDVKRTEDGTTITAWFSDWSGTRNLSATFAVHLLRRFVHARRGKLSALIAVEGASCELEAPDDNEVFVVKQRWAKREGDRLVFDDGDTAPAPAQETSCECWGCTSKFPDPRRQYVEVVRRSRIELLEKLHLMYLSPEATPEPEDDEISSDRVEVLRNFLPTRERELWEFFQARLASHPLLLACVLGDFFSLFRTAGADDKRLGRGLDLWFACLTHTDEQVRGTTFATTGYITAFRFDKLERSWATGETISRFRELCERADFASIEELESTGAVILRTVRKEAYENGAGLLLWARRHEDERFRAAAKAWSNDIDPALVALADELQAADADLAIAYQPALPSLSDAYALINAHLAETELEGRSTRQTKPYKKAKKKAAEVVVACQLLGQTLGTATLGERSDETLVAARRRVEVFALRDALSKLKKTMLTHADLVTILAGEPTAAIWSAEFVELTERSLEGHGYDDEVLSLIRTSLGRSEMDRSVEPEVRALLVGAISDDMMVWGLYPGEAEWTDRALTTLRQMEPEKAARWRAWLQHLSKWTTQSGAKYERWCERNNAIVGELGDEEVMKTIATWFDPDATPGRPRTTLKDEAAHLLGGLFWTVLESKHPASDATLGVAFHMCFGPCKKYWRRLANELRRRDTLAAYLVYFKTARPALLASRILNSSVWTWEAKVELLAAALTAASGSEAPEETIDEITTSFIKQMPDNFSQPFDQIRHHVCNAPARVPETLFRDHATRLVAACRPESIKDLRKVLQLRADARLHLEHADVVRLALFGVLYVPAKERMDWVIDEELDPFVPEICRVELPEEFAKDPSQFTSMALAFSSRLITRRKLHVAVEFLEIALSVREHADLYYNLACAWTLLSDFDAGFEAMARSVAMDPSNKRYALTDDELSTLRADPRFASL